MGFFTNQWLGRGQGYRDRKHRPVEVEIEAELAADDFDEENCVAVRIYGSKDDRQSQIVRLTLEEAEKVAGVIIQACDAEARKRLAIQLLQEMGDQDIVKALATGLRGRSKRKSKM